MLSLSKVNSREIVIQYDISCPILIIFYGCNSMVSDPTIT